MIPFHKIAMFINVKKKDLNTESIKVNNYCEQCLSHLSSGKTVSLGRWPSGFRILIYLLIYPHLHPWVTHQLKGHPVDIRYIRGMGGGQNSPQQLQRKNNAGQPAGDIQQLPFPPPGTPSSPLRTHFSLIPGRCLRIICASSVLANYLCLLTQQ